MLPDWFCPAGRGRSRGRKPGKQWRIHAPTASQPDANIPRHGDAGAHCSDHCASVNRDGHTGPYADGDRVAHIGANAIRDGNGKPDSNTRGIPLRHPFRDRHSPSNANANIDPQRDGPRGDQHDSADRNAAAADVNTAGAHANNGANADNSADETAAGVDFSP